MMAKRFGMIQYLQVGGFALLCLLAAGPGLVAARAFGDLTANYHDGNDTTYLIVGSICTAVAAIPFGIGVRSIWGAAMVVKATALAFGAVAVGLMVLVAG